MYGTVEDWKAWAETRGDSSPTDADADDASAALQRASDYVKYHYVSHFVAPYDDSSEGVEEATYVAAGIELATPNFFTSTYTLSQQKTLTQVGAIKWTPVSEKGKNSDVPMASPKSTLIEAMLSKYMAGSERYGITTIGATV